MAELPSYHDLAVVERSLLNALLEDHGSPAWQATYDHAWERDRATWDAVDEALRHGLRARPDGRRITSPPRWLDGLVNRRLRDLATNSWVGGFDQVRLLERLGLVAPPHDDVYVLAAVSGVKEPREQLAKDPALRAAIIWRLFEVEGGGQVSLANVDKYGRQRWRSALLALVAEGTLPRERVRVACLDALRRDFNHYRAAWFSATYLAFEPTREELAADQERLRGLLRSDVPATVSFALRQLQVIHKAGRLEPAPTIRALSPVVLARAKGTALAGLRLTESLAGQSEQLRSMAIEVARLGLQHEGSDVQAASARLLTKYGADLGDGVNLAPSVQSELGVSGTTNGFDVEQVPTQALRPPPDPATGADLVERLAALLEDASDAGELEAVLAGLAVLDEPEVLAPLRKRARAVHRRGPDFPLRAAMAALVLATEGAPFEELVLPQMRFVVRRIEGVAARLRGDRPRDPLLATPDATGGFVRASTIAARLSAASGTPDTFDVIAAQLRLHPDDVASEPGPNLGTTGEADRKSVV